METYYSQRLSATRLQLRSIAAGCVLAIGINMGSFYYISLPDKTARRQAAEVLSMTTAQIPVPDDYDQPATPQRTRQVLERQRCLDDYRFPLFHDIRERCERCCTESSVLCPLSQEIHAIYAREFGIDKKLAMISRSCQNKNRTIKEELKWLARLSKKRSSMFYHLSNRCEELCSDSPRPCHIWQEVYRIHRREMDVQEKEGGEKGMLRGRLNSWF